MRMINNCMENIRFCRMKEVKSDYIGTERVISDIGCFPVQIEYENFIDSTSGVEERKTKAKLIFDKKLPIIIGDKFCPTGCSEPKFVIKSIKPYKYHCVAEAIQCK